DRTKTRAYDWPIRHGVVPNPVLPNPPATFLGAIDRVAKRHLRERDATGPALADAVRDLSTVYTRERTHLGHGDRRSEAAAARLRFFLERDMLKVFRPVIDLHGQGILPTDPELRVLDLG